MIIRFPLTITVLALVSADITAQGRVRGGRSDPNATFKFLTKKYDRNRDGKITWKEYQRDQEKFNSLDADGDGKLTKEDFNSGGRGRGRGGGRRGGDRERGAGGVPKIGDVAPDFELPLAKTPKKSVKLSSFKDKKPVALIFGSYT
jgi:hypothetical protein